MIEFGISIFAFAFRLNVLYPISRLAIQPYDGKVTNEDEHPPPAPHFHPININVTRRGYHAVILAMLPEELSAIIHGAREVKGGV